MSKQDEDKASPRLKAFIGTEEVNAEPMTLKEFCDHRGWAPPEEKDPAAEGHLIIYPNGHEFWCPILTFEPEGATPNRFTLEIALIAARSGGSKIARAAWVKHGIFIVYQEGYPEGIPANKNTAEAFGIEEGEIIKVRPYLQVRSADGTLQPWAPTHTDILADDWVIID